MIMSNKDNKNENNVNPKAETNNSENNDISSSDQKKLEKELQKEYLSRFHSYEEKTVRNERIATGSSAKETSNNNKKKKKSTVAIIRTIILIISAVAFIVSGFVIAKRGFDFTQTKKLDNQIDSLTMPDDEFAFPSTSSEYLEALIEKYPHLKDVDFPSGFNYKYALLYAANKDFVGYLTIPGTRINTAVLQHSDDMYYYDHDFYGKFSKYGSIFVPAYNNMIYLDMNTTLMGHHMKDGSRFHDLKYYKTKDGYKKHPLIEFNTVYSNYKWKVYGAFILNGAKSGDDGYLMNTTFNNISEKSFKEYIAEIDKRTLYETGVDILPTDKILTLLTCTYEFDNARLFVIARMLRPGESEEIDLSLVKDKSSPIKYPKALYDKRGKTNPYANDEKWFPEK